MGDTLTVPELISWLKSAFQDEVFQDAERIISGREDSLRREIDEWKEKYRGLEIKQGQLSFAKAQADDDLQKARTDINRYEDNYREFVSRLKQAEEKADLALRRYGSRKETVPEKQPNNTSVNGMIGRVKEEHNASQSGDLCSPLSLQEGVSGLNRGGQKMAATKSLLPNKQPVAMMKTPEIGKASTHGAFAGTGRDNLVQPQVKKEPGISLKNVVFGSPPGLHRQGEVSGLNCTGQKMAATESLLPNKQPVATMNAFEKGKASINGAVAGSGMDKLVQPQVKEEPGTSPKNAVLGPPPGLHARGEGINELPPAFTIPRLIVSGQNHGCPKMAAESFLPKKKPEALMKISDKERASENGAISGICRDNITAQRPQVKEEPRSSKIGDFGSWFSPQGKGGLNGSNARQSQSQSPLGSKAGTSDKAPVTSIPAVSTPIIVLDDSDEEVEKSSRIIAASDAVSCTEVRSGQTDENGRSCDQLVLPSSILKRKSYDSSSSSSSSDDSSSSSESELSGADRTIASLQKRLKQGHAARESDSVKRQQM